MFSVMLVMLLVSFFFFFLISTFNIVDALKAADYLFKSIFSTTWTGQIVLRILRTFYDKQFVQKLILLVFVFILGSEGVGHWFKTLAEWEPTETYLKVSTDEQFIFSLNFYSKFHNTFIIIIIHILNINFSCLHGLDDFLIAIFCSVRFCAKSQSVSRDLKSLSTTCSKVFRGLPILCCPLTTISLHFFTTLSILHLFTWPKHLNLPLLMKFVMLSRPKRSLSYDEGFLIFFQSNQHFNIQMLHTMESFDVCHVPYHCFVKLPNDIRWCQCC